MYKKILILIASIFVGYILYLGFGFFKSVNKFIKKLDKIEAIEKKANLHRVFKDSLKIVSINKNDTIVIPLLDNRIKFMHYWATWCKPCVSEFPYFNSVVNKHKNIDFVFVTNEKLDVLKKFIKDKDYTNLSFYNHNYSNQIELLPYTILIKNDSIIGEYVGTQDWHAIIKNLK